MTRDELQKISEQVTTHDYRNHRRTWGRDITYKPEDGGMRLRGSLWSPVAIRPGDYVLLSNGQRDTRYRFTEIRGLVDPADMYHFTAEFAPRSEAGPQ